MIKTKIALINDGHEFSQESLFFGPLGWIVGKPERLSIHTNLSLEKFLEKLSVEQGGLLGNGELSLALYDTIAKPYPPNPTLMVFDGFIVFTPEQGN